MLASVSRQMLYDKKEKDKRKKIKQPNGLAPLLPVWFKINTSQIFQIENSAN